MGDNLAGCPDLSQGQDVILPIEAPIKPEGHIQILWVPGGQPGAGLGCA